MKFYHTFYTDLPDQFVEANSERLIKWVDGWSDKNRYYRRSMIIDSVSIDLIGNAKIHDWPTLKSASRKMVELWLSKKGDQYNGGYWDTLAEDQRRPAGVARDPRRDPRITNYTIDPSTVSAVAVAGAGGLVWIGSTEIGREPPPLKRDGIVAGEIVGYRCWRLERGLLRSVYQPDVWQPDEVLIGRELGDWDSRGIHAWKDAGSKQYHDYIRGYLNADTTFHVLFSTCRMEEQPDPRPAMVTGTVFLWGDVVEHERGYRAEFARVRSLDWLYPDATMMGREPETLNALRQKYVTAGASSGVFEKRST